MLIQLKKCLPFAFIAALFFLSCKKDLNNTSNNNNNTNPTTTGVTPDLSTKVTSSVSGFVTDENNAPVIGASVKAGDATSITDKYGYFVIRNTQVVKTAAVVTVTQSGYFKGIKTYQAAEGKAAFFRIKLIPKTNTGTISSSAGGNVTLANGMSVSLPVNSVVLASNNSPYTGTINVASYWINPTAGDLTEIMPGDLRGINTDGSLKGLTTYGMVAVELTNTNGELLQIATGQKATLSFPLPSSITATAPSSIPLWYFDENNGLWKQDGAAVKTGNTYVGEVSHFSFWNCDQPADYVHFDCTVVNSAGDPVPFTSVKISPVSNPDMGRWGYTDSSGYVGGLIPDNAQLLLEIFSNNTCGNAVYTQTFTTTSADISLGNITINSSSYLASVSGTVTDCASNPVTDGYIIVNQDGWLYRYPVSNTGTYDFTTILCNAPATVLMTAEDNIGLQQSPPSTQVLVIGSNTIGNLQACGVSTAEFLTYTINGASPSITYSNPGDSVYLGGNGTNSSYFLGAFNQTNNYTNLSFDNTGIAAGTTQNLLTFASSAIAEDVIVSTPIGINITEFGAVGEYVSGSFTGTVTGALAPNNPYLINCTFRVRRNF